MNEIIILYLLSSGQNTMYGIAKTLFKLYGSMTKPSFGTIQPAFKRLENQKFIKSDKFITDGGKPYYYFSITDEGSSFLREKLLSDITENPTQFITEAKIRISCSDILSKEEKSELFKKIILSLSKIKTEAETTLKSGVFESNFAGKMILDNTVCEYKNLLELVERIKNACNS